MKFGLSESQFDLLTQLAIQPVKEAGGRIWIFGSRARGDHQPFSDIDLLLELPASAKIVGKITEALEESRLPFKVDLVLIDELAESYREGVLKERIAL